MEEVNELGVNNTTDYWTATGPDVPCVLQRDGVKTALHRRLGSMSGVQMGLDMVKRQPTYRRGAKALMIGRR